MKNVTLKTVAKGLVLVGLVAVLAGCAYQPSVPGANLPGFFSGLIHGFFIPFELILGIFTDVRIYAAPNTGWFYDFGYFLGLGGLGGLGVAKYL